MNNPLAVLMFHALYTNSDELFGADIHYAKSVSDFSKLIDNLYKQGFSINSLRNAIKVANTTNKSVCFTFDDGHISNYLHAAPLLHNKCASADFFVNSAFIGTKNYIDWSGLREMHELGMSIQSHGHHHYYFDDLDSNNIRMELETSKAMIEDNIGAPVTIFAPPGGRITALVRQIALDIGYTAISTSRPGYWVNQATPLDIPRMAVLNNTPLDQIYSWAHLNKYNLNKVVAKYYITRSGKKLLGNRLYDKFRSAILGG